MSIRCAVQFFARDARTVARALLGCTLVRMVDGQRVAGLIVETEAYVGPEDRASHASGGRRTLRNEPMWGEPGVSYVYFTYGMHHCMNVSCLRQGHPAAVLIRALEPVEGIELMRKGRPPGVSKRDLCRGPARLCRALAIGPSLNAIDTVTSDQMWFEQRDSAWHGVIKSTARIGIANAGEWANKPLRYLHAGSVFVSGSLRANGSNVRAGSHSNPVPGPLSPHKKAPRGSQWASTTASPKGR